MPRGFSAKESALNCPSSGCDALLRLQLRATVLRLHRKAMQSIRHGLRLLRASRMVTAFVSALRWVWGAA